MKADIYDVQDYDVRKFVAVLLFIIVTVICFYFVVKKIFLYACTCTKIITTMNV